MGNGTDLELRKARPEETEKAVNFYRYIIDHQDEREFGVKWVMDVYPTFKGLSDAVENGEMHIGLVDGEIACAFTITGNDEIYNEITWPTEASQDEVRVIHLLTVHPEYGGRGLAKKMVSYAADISRAEGCKVIRLDVLKGNDSAEKLYLKCGFKYIVEQKMFYEDTGLADFRMFELVL